jgi:hypothetical protein
LAGNDPTEALQNFIQPLRQALHCITEAPLSVPEALRGRGPRLDVEYTATLRTGQLVELHGPNRLRIQVGHAFRLIETPDADRGPVKASTVRYQYLITTDGHREVFGYHWTPDAPAPQKTHPHMHIGSLVTAESAFLPKTFSGLHIPTGRVSLESVIRFLIEELAVETIIDRDTALDRLRQSEAAFHRYRTI